MKVDLFVKIAIIGIFVLSGTAFAENWQHTTGDEPIYTESSNVGIGTATPSNKLEVHSKIDKHFGIVLGRSGVSTDHNTWKIWNMARGYGHDFEIWQYPLDGLPKATIRRFEIMDNGNTNLVPSGGRVGIGTTLPQNKLHVYGGDSEGYLVRFSSGLKLGTRILFENEYNDVVDGFCISTGGEHGSRKNTFNFYTMANSGGALGTQIMSFDRKGDVGIGTHKPDGYKLNVAGKVRANEIVVNTTGADYVFEDGYTLKPLQEVESFIEKEKHLPDIPSAAEMQAEGVGISDMQTKLLAKVEELTLYLIEQDKKIEQMRIENETLKKKVAALEQ